MLILSCLAFLTGAVLALRCNMKIILLLCTAAAGIGTLLSISSGSFIGLLVAGVVAVALQVGYFASLLASAMGLTDQPVATKTEERSIAAMAEASSVHRAQGL